MTSLKVSDKCQTPPPLPFHQRRVKTSANGGQLCFSVEVEKEREGERREVDVELEREKMKAFTESIIE